MHTFVTFLGRGQQDRETRDWVYRQATYEFPGKTKDSIQETTEIFGLALAKHIKPKRVVILGTRGSQWSLLVEKGVNVSKNKEDWSDRWVELREAEKNQEINDEMLQKVCPLIQHAVELDKVEVIPCLISFGENEAQQYEILQTIADNVEEGTVSLDLTHGFRHLGMIGFLSAFMLADIGKLKVSNLWYGALDMTPREGPKKGITPVLKLNGLNHIRSWLKALNRFNRSGDYGVFVDLLKKDEVKNVEHLKNAAFYERTHNLIEAAEQIRSFLPVLKDTPKGASGLFQEELRECLTWVDEGTASKQQAKLARRYWERRDYARAAMFGWEALVTLRCEKEEFLPLNCYQNREKAGNHLSSAVQFWCEEESGNNRILYENLNGIRNSVVHGTPSSIKRVKEMLSNEENLREGLEKTLDLLKFVLEADE